MSIASVVMITSRIVLVYIRLPSSAIRLPSACFVIAALIAGKLIASGQFDCICKALFIFQRAYKVRTIAVVLLFDQIHEEVHILATQIFNYYCNICIGERLILKLYEIEVTIFLAPFLIT